MILETRLPVFLDCTRLIFLCCLRFYVVIEYICEYKKENWEPGDEARVYVPMLTLVFTNYIIVFGLKYPVSFSVIWLGDQGIVVGCSQTTPNWGISFARAETEVQTVHNFLAQNLELW